MMPNAAVLPEIDEGRKETSARELKERRLTQGKCVPR